MELTIFLSKVFGLYMLIGGFVVFFRRRYFMPIVGDFVRERLLRMIVATFELVGGLFLVVGHFDFSSLAAGLISVFGLAMVLEGLAYLSLSDDKIESILETFNNKAWYTWGGLISVLIGLYLVSYGFGLF